MLPPGLSRLASDYLLDFERVRAFYPAGAPFDWDRLQQNAANLAYPPERRAAMATVLRRQNQAWGVGAATGVLLDLFERPGTAAILTGQQVGLLGGPLLAVHKAMTAVLVAERLRAQGMAAVPIFWMATQDHDLAEVNQAWMLDGESRPVRIEAELALVPGASVGGARIEAPFGGAVELEEARAAYPPGATLGDAFARLFARWFEPWGLILFDPAQAPEAAALWQPHYRAALERQSELAQRLQARGAALEAAGYHAQVEQTSAASMVFLVKDGVRRGLRRQGEAWLLGEEPITAAAILGQMAARPETASPAALLRPVLQDVAFPTVAQVVGPAETAYLAQSAVLYAALGVRQPLAWPRASATLLDPKAQRLLDKYQVTVEDIWREPAAELLARRALPAGVERKAAAMRASFDTGFAQLTRELEALDPSLVDAAQGAVQKIRHQLEQLEARVARSFARRSEELTGQAQHLAGSLYPNRQLQERLLASAGWIGRYPDLPARLHAALDPATPEHQLVRL